MDIRDRVTGILDDLLDVHERLIWAENADDKLVCDLTRIYLETFEQKFSDARTEAIDKLIELAREHDDT